MSAPSAQYREIVDNNGRTYRIGESDVQILGRPRAWMVWLPWIAMMAVSVFEYGYSSASDTLEKAHGWSLTQAFWVASIWAVFQAAVAFPAGRLREKGVLPARTCMLIGAVLSGIGFASLAHVDNLWLALLLYSALGGTGAGVVYATCVNMVGKWYPEKKGLRTGFVNGGFAYGSVPFIFIFNYYFHPSNFAIVLDLIAVFMLVFVGACGFFFKDPPKNWWPADVDPLSKEGKSLRTLRTNPPAVRQYTPREALKTGQIQLMWVALVFIGGVSLFGINFQVPFAKALHFGPLIAASSAGVLSVVNGVGRGFVGWVSDHIGRRQTLTIVMAIAGLAQFGIILSGNAHNEPLFLVFAFLSGFGGGAFYPLFAALVPDYFGENNNASNYGMVYSAKLVGGVGAGGVGAAVITAWGFNGAYILAGVIGLLAAGITLFLRQPGRSADGGSSFADTTQVGAAGTSG